MIKVKNVLLTALVATFMVGGIASVEEASVNANAQTVHVHHAKKHAKKHTKKHTKKHAKKHTKKHTKKHSKKRVVKKHVKKSSKKHVRKVAKKHVVKKHVRKVAKKHVAKKRTSVKGFNTRYGNVSTHVIGTFHGFKYTKTYIDKQGVRVYQDGPRSFSPKMKIANGYIYTAAQGAGFVKTIQNKQPLPKDTEYVGFTYTVADNETIGGKVVAYAKWVPNDNSEAAKKDAENNNEGSKIMAQQNVMSVDGTTPYSHSNMDAYYQALKDNNIHMINGEVS